MKYLINHLVCRLLTIAPDAWNIPTVQKFVPLLDNYERDTLINEHVTAQVRIFCIFKVIIVENILGLSIFYIFILRKYIL